MIKLFKRMRGAEVSMLIGMSILILAQVWLELTMPDYMSKITTLVQTHATDISEIILAGAMMLLCAFGSMVMAIATSYMASRLGSTFSHRLRHDVFHKVQDFSLEEIGRFSTSSLITRSTNDVQQVQMVLAMGAQMIIRVPITVGIAISKIANKSWQWSAATAIAAVVMLSLVLSLIAICTPKFKIIQKLTDNLNRATRENLTGLRVVRAYNAEPYQEKKFDEANDKLTNTHLFTARVMSTMHPIISTMMSGLSLVIYWIGAVLISKAAGPDRIGLFSDMIVFSSYAMQLVMSFLSLNMIFNFLPRVIVSARRINEVLETEPTIHDGDKTIAEDAPKGTVEFRNVSFTYPGGGEAVLEDISFVAPGGKTTAIIGATGSGKTTLVNLIPRFYDVQKGSVLFDGVDVKDLKLTDLHNRIGYVSQKAQLFFGTVRSNINFGDNGKGEITDETVREAIEIAQGTEFVEKMQGTYDALISQNGANVSGGQRQRLSIARAVARKPEVYIFDDSFSALDYKTDRVLRTELKKKTAGVTSIIVAQRIGTIRDADQILVLDEGKIVGSGTHDELMASCEVYREIAYSQLSKEELGA